MVPKVALVTVDGLISIFYRSFAGATGIDRETSLPGFGWTSLDREIRSQSQRYDDD